MALSILDYSKSQGTQDWSGLRDAVHQYYGAQKGQAETDMYRQHGSLYAADAQKQQLINSLLDRYLNPYGQSQTQPQQGYGDNMGGGTLGSGAQMSPGQQMQNDVSQLLGGQRGGQQMNPIVSGILSKELGLEKPYHTLNSDNHLVTYDPLTGMVSTQPTGRLPEDIERAKVKNTKEEERLQVLKDKSLAEYMVEDSKQPILNELMGIVNDPRFMQATGKYQNIVQSIKPDANVQALKGEFNLYTGELVNRASSVFGSNLTQGMYNTMRRIKANESDEPMANKSKVLMANMLSRQNLAYQRALLNNLDQGIKPIDAAEQARASVDGREIKDFLMTENKAYQLSHKMKVDYEQLMRNAYRASEALQIPVNEVLSNFEKDSK